ncbi:hypothetical protein ACD578_05495 [Microvirga sp. RSM25]|uniref:hypothetical protein n=1 Tax=Microvirga sp. RSM25 TaxID=3273802 RepID=UPI00384B6D76
MNDDNPYAQIVREQREKKRAEDAEREQRIADKNADATHDFRVKSEPLITILVPKLKQARDGFAGEGFIMQIEENLEPTQGRRNPSVRFSVSEKDSRDKPTWFEVEVGHVQGGVRVRTEKLSHKGEISERIGMKTITPQAVDQLIQVAVSHYFKPNPLIFDR